MRVASPALRVVAAVFALAALLFGAAARDAAAQAFPVSVTDIAGRSVTVAARPERIVLADGVQAIALAILDPDMAGRLVLRGADLEAYDPGTDAALASAFPGLAAVPTARDDGAGIPTELVLGARPDLVVFSLWQKPRVEPLVAQLEALGIPVLFVDFFVSPVAGTPASMRALGAAIGRAEAGEAYARLFETKLDAVRAAVAAAGGPRPSVLVHAFPGLWACCWSAGGGGIGEFVAIAGGRSVGADLFPDDIGGALAIEYVLAADPDVYVATGLSAPDGVLLLGGGISVETARAGLANALAGEPVAGFRAVREGRAFGLWNYFNGSPLNILAIEALAAWLHPAAAAGLDPAATRREIEERFLGRPLPGTFWTAASPGGAAP